MKLNNDFNQEFLKSVLHYDPETGIFTRLSDGSKLWKGNNRKGYLLISIKYNGKQKQYYAHRLAWLYMTGKWPKEYIDHIDLIKDNNKWKNLRECNNAENLRNRKANKNNTTGYKGIHKNKQGYMVRICIGTYKTLEEASKVYEQAIKLYHGKFARLK